MSKLDLLAFGAHPDDVELSAGGTMCLLARQGYRVGVVDLTEGQLGTRGTPSTRKEEAARASAVMGLEVRENLGMMDGAIDNSRDHQLRVIRTLRTHRPHIALIGSLECRHPDHGAAARLCADAAFYAGLRKIATHDANGEEQEPWRPHHILHYMQAIEFDPTFVVDVSDVWPQKIEAMKAYRSQFYNPDYEDGENEPETFVSNERFFKWIEARARFYGYRIGAEYGEPFRYRHGPIGITDLVAVLSGEKLFR